jgi:hypothetical protein
VATSRLTISTDEDQGEWITLPTRMPSMSREEARRLLLRPAATQLRLPPGTSRGIY